MTGLHHCALLMFSLPAVLQIMFYEGGRQAYLSFPLVDYREENEIITYLGSPSENLLWENEYLLPPPFDYD